MKLLKIKSRFTFKLTSKSEISKIAKFLGRTKFTFIKKKIFEEKSFCPFKLRYKIKLV